MALHKLSRAPIPEPERRKLRTFAFDPMSSRLTGRILTLDVPFEPLQPGPEGSQVIVVDYDAVRNVWYEPVNLDDGAILVQDGLAPSEADPRSHQQIVYAVSASVLERVERHLGRRFRWRGNRKLRLIPHAFEGRNAYFDPRRGVLFGYYRADLDNPGANIPGQTIFSCLSNDIIAHELTHAIVHRLRPHYLEPTNGDVFALHEGVADLVALFHHFVDRDVVYDAIAQSAGQIETATALFNLALEFGHSTGRGRALRQVLTDAAPAGVDPLTAPRDQRASRGRHDDSDPHVRGANFVMGVFDAFLDAYRSAIADLLRIASGGTGVLPEGRLHPDLVSRLTDEAVKYADRYLGMVIRAFDYMPVVDPTLGDMVRAIVTADHDLFPGDAGRLRARLVEGFRGRGIWPDVAALSDEAIIWPSPTYDLSLAEGPGRELLAEVIMSETTGLDRVSDSLVAEPDVASDGEEDGTVPYGRALGIEPPPEERLSRALRANIGDTFSTWAMYHARELGLDPESPIHVDGIHVSYRQAVDQRPRPELVVQLSQVRRDLPRFTSDPSVAVRAGTTVIARADGAVRYIVAKPLPEHNAQEVDDDTNDGNIRYSAVDRWVSSVVDNDPAAVWQSGSSLARLTFASLHEDDA